MLQLACSIGNSLFACVCVVCAIDNHGNIIGGGVLNE